MDGQDKENENVEIRNNGASSSLGYALSTMHRIRIVKAT